jgi:nucleotide-binding universal stress UspA family protein
MAAARKPLVVGVCEHAHSTAALRYAADRARRSQEEIVAVHVRAAVAPVSYFDVTGVQRTWEAECEELAFSDTVATLGGRAPSWRYLSRRGDPARCLAATAVELGATAIVLGHDIARRFGWLRRTVTRSLRSGPVPVVVVDSAARPVPAGRRAVRQDGQQGGRPAVAAVRQERREDGGDSA